jgi:rRNA small subunit pseudouridine methyltransferase Nep1
VITLILAEAELERVPNQILFHPAIRMQAKQKRKPASHLILDASLHHTAMKSLPEGRRRGRPDITHIYLLCVLESIANKKNMIKDIIVHTRNNDAIFIHPETRIMRNYPRFIGLMEQLFEKHRIDAGNTTLLQQCKNTTLETIIKNLDADHVMVCSDDGKRTDLNEYFTKLQKRKHSNLTCIIGGFPSGGLHSDISSLSDEIICIYQEKLTAWTTASEVLSWYHHIFSE